MTAAFAHVAERLGVRQPILILLLLLLADVAVVGEAEQVVVHPAALRQVRRADGVWVVVRRARARALGSVQQDVEAVERAGGRQVLPVAPVQQRRPRVDQRAPLLLPVLRVGRVGAVL